MPARHQTIHIKTSVRAQTTDADAWKQQLATAIRDPRQLLQRLSLHRYLDRIDLQPGFPCLVTGHYLSKMEAGNIDDPLLRQVLPLKQETSTRCQQGGQNDPVGDLAAMAAPGLLHKYHSRALLISTAACAIHCRYCFRRQFPYQGRQAGAAQMAEILAYLQQHEEIDEIILSGGDPLVLDNDRLRQLLTKLQSLPQLQTLRIHTRLPLLLPSRIDAGLLQLLRHSRLQVVMVIHANHANELDTKVAQALNRLRAAGITLLNQSVLLAGVNDSAACLITLSKRLWQCHTLPYYLHLLDPVAGAMHFEVDEARARQILHDMEGKLPGYLLPRLVREIPGKPAKTAIFRN